MAKLTAAQRKQIPSKDFALPAKRSKSGGSGGYPIPDPAHAKNALSRVAQFGSPGQIAAVRSKVSSKFPSIGKKAKS